jgi:hypothetical protein
VGAHQGAWHRALCTQKLAHPGPQQPGWQCTGGAGAHGHTYRHSPSPPVCLPASPASKGRLCWLPLAPPPLVPAQQPPAPPLVPVLHDDVVHSCAHYCSYDCPPEGRALKGHSIRPNWQMLEHEE